MISYEDLSVRKVAREDLVRSVEHDGLIDIITGEPFYMISTEIGAANAHSEDYYMRLLDKEIAAKVRALGMYDLKELIILGDPKFWQDEKSAGAYATVAFVGKPASSMRRIELVCKG